METHKHCETDGQHFEALDSRKHSSCFLPPIVEQQTSVAGEPGVQQTCVTSKPGVQQAERGHKGRHMSDTASQDKQQKQSEEGSLLEELGRIEAALRESVRLDIERQREAEFLRQQGNNLLRTNLSYLSLSQRVAKPWVSSYFRKFPMHIYCLPVQAANHRGWRRGLVKRK